MFEKSKRGVQFTSVASEDDVRKDSGLTVENIEKDYNLEYKGTHEKENDGYRKSTLRKFSKEVFISRVELVDHRRLGEHIAYVIRVRGRTKYLVNVKDLAEIGLISKQAYIRDQKMEEIRKSTITSKDA